MQSEKTVSRLLKTHPMYLVLACHVWPVLIMVNNTLILKLAEASSKVTGHEFKIVYVNLAGGPRSIMHTHFYELTSIFISVE